MKLQANRKHLHYWNTFFTVLTVDWQKMSNTAHNSFVLYFGENVSVSEFWDRKDVMMKSEI